MAQQHLHRAQIGAMIDEMSREGMPQGMRREGRLHRALARIAFDQIPKRLTRHRRTALRNEQAHALHLVQRRLTRLAHITFEPCRRLFAARHQPLLIALAYHTHHALAQLELRHLETVSYTHLTLPTICSV